MSTQISGGPGKKFQMTNLNAPNIFCFIKYAQKSDPGLADVGVAHGGKDGSRPPAPGSGSKMAPYHIDQLEILKA